MDRFRELEMIVAVADAGGFKAASRTTGLSPPSITRLVAALERRIGTRMFARTTRRIALTEAGRRFVDDARRILADLESAEGSAAGAHEDPQGVLSITAPVLYGERFVAPIVRDYLDRYPRVNARMLFVDRIVNLIEEGLDVAVRIGSLPDSSLTAIRVGSVRRIVTASPEYLRIHGMPDEPADLARHRTVSALDMSMPQRWSFNGARDATTVMVTPALRVNSIAASIDAALAGWGIVRTLSYQVAPHIRSGALVPILEVPEPDTIPIHLVHAEGQLRTAKIRTFLDLATARLRQR